MSVLLSSIVLSTISKLFTETGLTNVTIETGKLSADTDGYTSYVTRALIKGFDGDISKSYDTVVKTLPSDVNARKYISSTLGMGREILFYKTILPSYQCFEEDFIENKEQRLDFPKYFVSSEDYLNEMLVIENLKRRNFSLAHTRDALDYEHGTLIVRALAKFHALSLMFQDKQPDKYKNIVNQLTDVLFESDKDYDAKGVLKYAQQAFEKFVSAIKHNDYKNRLRNKVGNFSEELHRLFNGGNIKVISHGDYWINNIMFKYKNNLPDDIIILDYQLLHHCSIANDFLAFMGTCFDLPFRRNYYQTLLQDYYNALEEHLTSAGYRRQHFFTKDQFEEELKKQSFFGLSIGIFMIAFFDTEVLDIQVLYSGDLPSSFFEVSEKFKEMANGLVEDYVAWGYL